MIAPPSGNRTVIATDHTNSGIRYSFMLLFMLNVVDMQFTAPRVEDTPIKCREKTARSHYYYYYYYSNCKYWATVSPELSRPPWDPDYRGIFLVPTSQTIYF